MGNNEIKISIIMPSLNVENYIEECIQSVVNQTFEDIEIICVDAGSTDGTLKVIEKFSNTDSRVRVIHSDKKSYGHQMNLGISNAKGDYIGIVETDDYIDDKMYETLYDLTNNGSTDISKVSFYHVHDYDENNIELIPNHAKINCPKGEFTIYDDVNIIHGHPSIWAAIYKRSFLMENNIKFMESPGGGWVDNPFLFETLLLAKKITFKDVPCYYYREFNPDSSTNSMKDLTLPMRRMLNNLDVLDKYSCSDKNIFAALYIHIFWHIHETLKKDNYDEEKENVDDYFTQVVNRLDESIILKKFQLKDQKVFYQFLNNSNFENTIKNTNIIVKKSIDKGKFEKRLPKIFNRKINTIFLRYSYTKSEFREEYYNLIRDDFKRMYNHIIYEEFISSLTSFNNDLFKAVVLSSSFEEFDLLYNNLLIKKEIKQISKKNKKLKKEIRKSKKLNKTIVNSNSWTITKPLRFLKKVIKQ